MTNAPVLEWIDEWMKDEWWNVWVTEASCKTGKWILESRFLSRVRAWLIGEVVIVDGQPKNQRNSGRYQLWFESNLSFYFVEITWYFVLMYFRFCLRRTFDWVWVATIFLYECSYPVSLILYIWSKFLLCLPL